MAGYDRIRVVECYPSLLNNNERPHNHMRVCGKQFHRRVYVSDGNPDVLIDQVFWEDDEYVVPNIYLPLRARDNQNYLRHCIVEAQPAAYLRRIPPQFENLDWTWERAADIASAYVEESGILGRGESFYIQIEEAFGTTFLMREQDGWLNQDWRQNPPRRLGFTNCYVCLEDISYAPVATLIGIQTCQHMYHKSCIYSWLWYHQNVATSCPICNIEM